MTQPDLWAAPTAGQPVTGKVRLPGSKSLTNRALVLAALAEGPSKIRAGLRSRDTELMSEALGQLGASVAITQGDVESWTVTPQPLQGPADIECGLAGTVMRFLPPLAALAQGAVYFDGDPHARTRPMAPIITALRQIGGHIDDHGRGTLPFLVHGRGGLPGGRVAIDASTSSQFVSALLLSGARYDRGVEVEHVGPPLPSKPHVDMTVSMLRSHGVAVDQSGPTRWRVEPSGVDPLDLTIEPDLSTAAPFLAAGAVTGGPVTVLDWPRSTTQAGDRLRGILTEMGASVVDDPDGVTVSRPGPLRGIDMDLRDVGELTPTVAALAALAESPSVLRGVAHIRGHETDRLVALSTELSGLGARVTELPDGLRIQPAPLHGGTFRTYGDHRMAHAAVIVGLVVPGVLVENVETTGKTFPGFAQAWSALVGE